MPDQAQITDSKLDQQTSLLRWILGGVGASIVGAAAWMASQFVQDKSFLRDDIKASLKSLSESNASIAKSQEAANSNQVVIVHALENQTQVMRDLRDITRRGEWREIQPAAVAPPPP